MFDTMWLNVLNTHAQQSRKHSVATIASGYEWRLCAHVTARTLSERFESLFDMIKQRWIQQHSRSLCSSKFFGAFSGRQRPERAALYSSTNPSIYKENYSQIERSSSLSFSHTLELEESGD